MAALTSSRRPPTRRPSRSTDKTIRIAGVDRAGDPEETCAAAGRRRLAVRAAPRSIRCRMFLGGRAIECYFPYADTAVEITAPCRVGECRPRPLAPQDRLGQARRLRHRRIFRRRPSSAHCNRRGLVARGSDRAGLPGRANGQSALRRPKKSPLAEIDGRVETAPHVDKHQKNDGTPSALRGTSGGARQGDTL